MKRLFLILSLFALVNIQSQSDESTNNGPRNIAIFLNKKEISVDKSDAVLLAFMEALARPTNYSIFTNRELIQSLKKSYDLYLKEKEETNTQHAAPSSRRQRVLTISDIIHQPLNIVRRYYEADIFNSWEISSAGDDFYILTPKQLEADTSSNNTISYPLADFFNGKNLLAQVHSKNISQEKFGSLFLQRIKKVIQRKKIKNKTLEYQPLNIYIMGHGLNSDHKKTACGLEIKTFKDFTHILATVNGSSLFYNTCYGGGRNTLYVFDTELPYVVIATGTNDTVIYKNHLNASKLNSYFKTINSSPSKALSFIIQESPFNERAHLVEQDFKIRLPYTSWFTPAQLLTKTQTIGKIKTLTSVANDVPIILSGKPCALLTTLLGKLEVPAHNRLPIFVPIALSKKKNYFFEQITINQNHNTLPEAFALLDSMFKRPSKENPVVFEEKFYIKLFKTTTLKLSYVVIKNNQILVRDKTGTLYLFNRDSRKYIKYEKMSSLEQSKLKFYITKPIKELAKEAKEKFSSLNNHLKAKPSSFVDLKELVEKTNNIEEFKMRYAQEISQLQPREKKLIESILKAQKSL